MQDLTLLDLGHFGAHIDRQLFEGARRGRTRRELLVSTLCWTAASTAMAIGARHARAADLPAAPLGSTLTSGPSSPPSPSGPSARAVAMPGGFGFASAYSDGVFHTVNLRQFANRVRERTSGEVRLDVQSNATLMPMNKVLPALQDGSLAFGEVLMSSYAQQFPLLEFDALPFVLNNFQQAAHMWEVTREPVESEMLKAGVRLLYVTPWPAQGLFARSPVTRLEDLRGMRFRVYNETSTQFAKSAGAVPVDIPASELPAAIEAGKVDAMFTSTPTAVDCQAWRCMTSFIPCAAWVPKNMVCASEKVWQRLTAQQQASVMAAAKEAEVRGWKLAQEADEQALAKLQQKKVQVVPTTPELRRALDVIGERFASTWARRAGFKSTAIFLRYYNQQV